MLSFKEFKDNHPSYYSKFRLILQEDNDERYAEEVAIMEHYFNKYSNPKQAGEKYWEYRFSSQPHPNITLQQRHWDVAKGKKTEADLGIDLSYC